MLAKALQRKTVEREHHAQILPHNAIDLTALNIVTLDQFA
jgi:hypothetical protein